MKQTLEWLRETFPDRAKNVEGWLLDKQEELEGGFSQEGDIVQSASKLQEELFSLIIRDPASQFRYSLSETAARVVAHVVKKNADYGDENIKVFGEKGLAVRATDKIMRLKNIVLGENAPKVTSETTEDTWLDLAGYSLIALALKRGLF